MKNSNRKAIKKTVDIVIYVLTGFFFLIAIVGIVLKFTNNRVEVFGKRFDVVLTDSMSTKNKEYEDFLKGHDNQIQALDVVISETNITEDDLNIYDIVLFDNPAIGATDMHRIVDKTEKNIDQITISNSYVQTINGIKGFSFNDVSGGIVSNVICSMQITLVTYSDEYDEEDHYTFSHQLGFYDPQVEREAKDGGYYTKYTVLTGTTAPRKIAISHKKTYDYSSEVISSCVINSTEGLIDINEENMKKVDDDYVGSFNVSYYYEIRGDKANTSDGTNFTIDQIYGKVTGTIPKIGILIRYLSSVWGMVLFVGLAALFIAYDVLASRMNKKALDTMPIDNGGDALNEEKGNDLKSESRTDDKKNE